MGVSCVYLDRKVGVCLLLDIIKFLEALISIVLWWHIQIESMLGVLMHEAPLNPTASASRLLMMPAS